MNEKSTHTNIFNSIYGSCYLMLHVVYVPSNELVKKFQPRKKAHTPTRRITFQCVLFFLRRFWLSLAFVNHAKEHCGFYIKITKKNSIFIINSIQCGTHNHMCKRVLCTVYMFLVPLFSTILPIKFPLWTDIRSPARTQYIRYEYIVQIRFHSVWK